MKRNLEVLAPAGDLEILRAAISAGADAVYFGGELFGARAFAHNFTFEDAQRGIEYAHSRGAKTYLTVNTLLKNTEIERKVYDYIRDYYNAGIDAVLVQDIGLMQLIRTYFPELHLHISTQANVTSEYGAEFFKKLGASRIVLARELSLKEIRQIHESCDIELECFAHGALCVSYSGQCLMSSMIGGRSGNRGRCAQPCRKCYDVLDDHKQSRQMPGKYPISMKDLCTITDVKALYEAGCSSLKIEGRMKSREYVTAVVSSYRRLVDHMMNEEHDRLDMRSLKENTLLAGTRGGSTDGYLYKRNGSDMITFKDSSFSSDGSESLSVADNRTKAKAVFTAKVGEPLSLTISTEDSNSSVTGAIVEKAKKPKNVYDEIRDKIMKAGDDRIDITEVTVDADSDAFVPMSLVKSMRRDAIQQLFGGIEINRSKPIPFVSLRQRKTHVSDDIMILVTCLNETQVDETLSYFADKDLSIILAINYDLNSQSDIAREDLRRAGNKLFLCLPDILRSDMLPQIDAELFDGFIISSYDEIEYVHRFFPDKPCIYDQRLYAWSDRSRNVLLSFGADYICAPVELNEKELSHLDNSRSIISVYGRTPVMYTTDCTHKNSVGCDKRREVLYLRDERNAYFPVVNECSDCTNVIYNSLPTSLLPFIRSIVDKGFAGVRLDFTIENAHEVKEVLSTFLSNISENRSDDITCDVTRGHFHRGVS